MPFLPVDHQANGSIAANAQTVLLDVTRHAIATVTLTGTWVGTVQFEVTTDNVTWVGIPVTPVAGGATVTSATANGTWSAYVSAYAAVRLRASAWTSGSVAVAIRASAAGGSLTALTAGSIVFANASGALAQDSSNLFWDSTNHRLGLRKLSPSHVVDIASTGLTESAVNISHIITSASGGQQGYAPVYLFGQYNATDAPVTSGIPTNPYHGLKSDLYIGVGGVQAVGTAHAASTQLIVQGSGLIKNEFATYFGAMRFDTAAFPIGGVTAQTTPGRAWFTDWSLHGAIGEQHDLFNGISMFVNYYDPRALSGGGPKAGLSISTGPATGGAIDAAHAAATTYTLDNGIVVSGQASGATAGWTTAYQAGGQGGTWNPGSIIGTGFYARDVTAFGFKADNPSGAAARVMGGIAGTWLAGIDMSGGTFTGGAAFEAGNAQSFGGKDLDGNFIPMLRMQSDNTLNLGTIAAPKSGGATNNGHVIVYVRGVEVARWQPAGSFIVSEPLIFGTDNSMDIGASGATRARDFFLARNSTVGGHLLSTQTTGTVAAAAGVNAGTTPPAPVLTACTDTKGSLTFGTGTTPALGAQVAVTFGTAYATAPVVHVQEQNSATKALGAYISAVSTTGFTVSTTGAPAASQANTTYSIGYAVIG